MTQLSPLCLVVLAIPLGLASIAGSEREARKTGSSDELGRQISMAAVASPTGADRVTLAFDAVRLDDLVPFLMQESGKVVTVDPDATGYMLTLISSDVMSRDEAFTRVMNKLRSDGLDVRETEDTIVISAGQYRQIWKPRWRPKEDDHEDAGQRSTKAQVERAEPDERASMLLAPPEADHHHMLSDLHVWRHEVGGTPSVTVPPNGVNPNPLVVGDLVVASIFSPRKIVALDRQTGEEKWSFDLPDLGSSHVSFIDGVLYAKTSRTLYALDPQSGRKKWEWTPHDVEGEWVYSSPAVAGNRLYIGDRLGVLHCLSTTTGKLLWSKAFGGSMNASAVVVDDVVITATNSAFAIAYATDSGGVLCQYSSDPLCRLTIVGTEHSAQAFSAMNRSFAAFWHLIDKFVGQSLMRTLDVIMLHVLVDGPTKMAFSDEDHSFETFGFDG